MSTAENPDRGHSVEEIACYRWPAERVDDQEASWYDIEFVDDVDVELSPAPVVAQGTLGEVKSCYPFYDDRAGRVWIRRENHERLLAVDGVYIVAVVERETEEVLRMGLSDASTIDAIIDEDWWECGQGGRSAEQYRQIPWTTFFDRLDSNGGDQP